MLTAEELAKCTHRRDRNRAMWQESQAAAWPLQREYAVLLEEYAQDVTALLAHITEQVRRELSPTNLAASRTGYAEARGEAEKLVRGLVAVLREAMAWTAKLAADAPDGMVGQGKIIRLSLNRIEQSIERGERYLGVWEPRNEGDGDDGHADTR